MLATRILVPPLFISSRKVVTRDYGLTETLLRSASASSGSQRRIFKLEPEKVDKILDIFNNKTKEDLLRYPVSKIRLDKINNWKSKNGLFNSIEQLLELDGFGIKMLEKLCENILRFEESPTRNDSKSITAQPKGIFTIPTLPTSLRDRYKSCISLFHSVSNVAWCRIELNEQRPCTLTHWQHYDLNVKRMHLTDLVEQFRVLIRSIPEADCYVFENPQVAQATAPGGAEQVNINVQKAQMTAMLNYALADRGGKRFDSENLKVFYLKKYLSGRVFNTLVGSERVSTEQVVAELLRTIYNEDDFTVEVDEEDSERKMENTTLRGNINASMELRKIYHELERYQRDFLGQALLIGMTFVRLCLLRDAASIAIVTRNPKESDLR